MIRTRDLSLTRGMHYHCAIAAGLFSLDLFFSQGWTHPFFAFCFFPFKSSTYEKKIMSTVFLEFCIFFGGMACIAAFILRMCYEEGMDDDWTKVLELNNEQKNNEFCRCPVAQQTFKRNYLAAKPAASWSGWLRHCRRWSSRRRRALFRMMAIGRDKYFLVS